MEFEEVESKSKKKGKK